ncbi:winged helix-turn-helix transcriptional regulator [Kitasatospora viridis]|uniref:Winged helix-turn-helix DNA-binding protein n=1 Tax=Kitasatospora viridis TaxID=281105 RepID=A0A561UHS1_9ACTN|nr:winged helix-turn-helix transcriptional regulator [Kitasatospora viridis]TWF98903.1 winged helix-turn-helix DNA-binding protein [Kitasatospora viridis]
MTVPALPGAAARALYRELLADGGLFDLAQVSAREPAALAQLRATGLVVELHEGQWGTADPRRAAGLLRAQYREAAVELLLRADEPVRAMDELAQAYDSAALPPPAERSITHVEGLQQIQQRLGDLILESRYEILSMQPGGARPAVHLPRMYTDVEAIRGRGIELRTLYQPGADTDPATVAYAAHATALGARIRILDEPFRRLMVLDRSVVVLAGHASYQVATFVEDPVVVGLVLDQFERDWTRAERVRWDPPPPSTLADLLARGLTQRAIANRLGLSERTVAAQIARLREEYDADTLFQLGWLMRATS